MKHRHRSFVLALLAACGGTPQTSTPPQPPTDTVESSTAAPRADEAGVCPAITLPDTPVGRRMMTFVRAVGRGEASELGALVDEDFAPGFRAIVPRAEHIEILANIHQTLGTPILCRVDYDTPTEVMALLASSQGDAAMHVLLEIEPEAPHGITGLSFQPAAAQALEDAPDPLDDRTRHAIVESIADALGAYVFADAAAAMQQRLRARRDAGDYAGLSHRMQLARRLTADLRGVSSDRHLKVIYSPSVLPPEPEGGAEPTPQDEAHMRQEARAEGFGLARVEVLDDGIGYIDVRAFYPLSIAREPIAEAMTTLADSDAIIVDLRHNHGGDPASVAFMTSYLYGADVVHLNDLYYRARDETIEYWTEAEVPGARFGPDKPVVVLTSAETFSGGEEFAYNLRALGRATLIGEVTGGGAHPSNGVRVDDHLIVVVPVGRAINPITKSNWEGTGVEPHVEIPASEALEHARRRLATSR